MIESQIAQMLKEARQKKNLSIEQASKAIPLRVSIIEHFENGAFEKLGALLYIKSHLRKYAHFLDLDMTVLEEFLIHLEKKTPSDGLERYLDKTINNEENKRLVKHPVFKWYLISILLLCLIGGAGYFFYGEKLTEILDFNRQPSAPTELVNEHTEEQEIKEVVNEQVIPPAERKKEELEPIVTISDSEVDKLLTQSGVVFGHTSNNGAEREFIEDADLIPPDHSVLKISVTEECWTEVHDGANGEALINEVLSPGEVYYLTGVSPFTIKVGNASAINEITIDGLKVGQTVYKPKPNTSVKTFVVNLEEVKKTHGE